MTAILGAGPRPLSDQAIVTVVANHPHTVHGVERAIVAQKAVVDLEEVAEVTLEVVDKLHLVTHLEKL